MSLVGWVHTILAVVALIAGAFNLVATAAMLVACQFAGDWLVLALATSGGALLFAGWRLRAPAETPLLAREVTP